MAEPKDLKKFGISQQTIFDVKRDDAVIPEDGGRLESKTRPYGDMILAHVKQPSNLNSSTRAALTDLD